MGPDRDPMMRRALAAWAATHAAIGRVIAAIDPTWRTDVFELSTGVAAIHGAGLYVNRACAVGIERPLADDELDELERRCRVVGVAPAVEVSALTHPASIALLARRGYRVDDRTTAHRRRLDDVDELPPSPGWLSIERVDDDDLLAWQETTAVGWGHDTPTARRASDTYTAGAARIGRLLLAVDRTTGAAVGAAALTIDDRIADLGGMSTVPAARGRGVQGALIAHRLRAAAEAGCELATTTTASPDNASARNLGRYGFRPWFEIATHSATGSAAAASGARSDRHPTPG